MMVYALGKKDHRAQVAKYIKELKKQVKKSEKVFDTGFVINFIKIDSKTIKDEAEKIGGIEVLTVNVWSDN